MKELSGFRISIEHFQFSNLLNISYINIAFFLNLIFSFILFYSGVNLNLKNKFIILFCDYSCIRKKKKIKNLLLIRINYIPYNYKVITIFLIILLLFSCKSFRIPHIYVYRYYVGAFQTLMYCD